MNERVFAKCLLSAILLTGCGDPPTTDDAGGLDANVVRADSSVDGGSVEPCARDLDCSDSSYCNGEERCMPGAPGTNAEGCMPGEAPCSADEICSEDDDSCAPIDCVDEDSDGFDTCSGDCDDSNPNINPSTEEECVPDDPTDEDCNPRTYGFIDIDMDGAADARCFNIDTDGTRHGGTDCDDNNASFGPTAAEVCDGRFDENCDGVVDEDCLCSPEGSSRGCGSGLGECSGAVETCTAAGWTMCSATAGTELCDGSRDEDCDGSVDEGCSCVAGTTQACGRGACGGLQRCTGGSWDACDGASPTTELCDGIDSDCDGIEDASDPDVVGVGDACGESRGACVAGTRSCMRSTLACVGAVGPTTEVCDGPGLDEDCDGVSNEDCLCTSGNTQPCQTGDCSGTQLCTGGAWGACLGADGLPAPTPGSITEVCDGRDNNCNELDDASDPAVVGVGDACGTNVGECVAGTQVCIGSSLMCGGSHVGSGTETCNHHDDNCDGNTDNGVSIAAECGLTIEPGNAATSFNYNCYPGEAACNGANLAGGTPTNQAPRSAFARWTGDFGRRAYFRMRTYLTRTSSGPSAGWVSMVIAPTRGTSGDTSSTLIADGLPTLSPTTPAIAVSLNGAGNAFYLLHNTSAGWRVLNGPHAMPSGCTSVPTARTPYTFEFNNDGGDFVARVAQVSCATRITFTDAALWEDLYGSGASYPTFYLGLAADNDGGLDADLRDLHVERWIRGTDRNNCLGC